MSRTDKDTPWWVVAEEWEPLHYRCQYAVAIGWRNWNRLPRAGESPRTCDLPAVPGIRQLRDYYIYRRQTKACVWIPVWTREARTHQHYNVPNWYQDLVDTSPTRRQVRDDCIKARKEYRATGDVDVIPPINQHRHCARWLWW